MLKSKDKKILRELALKVKDIASDPINDKKIIEWKKHNSLKGNKPMIFVFPDVSWNELLPFSSLECENDIAKNIEYQLKKRIIRDKYIKDDVPIIADVEVQKAITNTMWGVTPIFNRPKTPGGAFHHVSIIENSSDWSKLSQPIVTYNEAISYENHNNILDAIGDIVPVNHVGIKNFSFHMLHWYCDYRGLDNLMTDLYDEPETVHKVIRFFTDGVKSMLKQYEEQNLISLNNDCTHHYTGGVGYTDELPKKEGFNANHIRLCDVWGAAEAQEFSSVSPKMHEEFILQYERELLQPFGLNGYGCCDDLSKKLDGVLKIKNLRRVAACPWADISQFVPRLLKNYIITWKPQPSYLAFDKFDKSIVENELKNGLLKAKGGIIELILRDTLTCRNQPERFSQWVDIARKAIEEVWV